MARKRPDSGRLRVAAEACRAWLPQEFELAKLRQDRQLEGIEKGLGTLREVASAMGEALEHQDVLVDAITEKVRAAGCLTL